MKLFSVIYIALAMFLFAGCIDNQTVHYVVDSSKVLDTDTPAGIQLHNDFNARLDAIMEGHKYDETSALIEEKIDGLVLSVSDSLIGGPVSLYELDSSDSLLVRSWEIKPNCIIIGF